MGDYGMKVSKAGFDVKTCDDDDLVFSSKFNQLKRKASGTATTSGSDIQVAHGLGYKPIYFGLRSRDTNRYKMGYGGVDATNLNLDHLATATYWRYYIFYHTGA